VGGNRRFARTASRISRSEFKLLEAFDVFGLSPEPGGAALDLGAAPGGWSRLLRERGLRVTAVDPAKLDDRLRGDKDLRHIRTTAKKFLQQKPEKYDLIVNDMRMDARKSAQLMVSCAPYLNPGGFGIMTLKLPEEKREIVIDEAYQILSGTFRIAGARQLFHNRSEITVYLRLP
jgi:23S rRNA (cytidine2498-2'-O)-methyltransferase